VEGGRLGFVITQSVFKTVGGGEGFRSFEYEAGGAKWYLPPIRVHDLSDFQPFEGASNRTAVLIVGKEKRAFSYPVSYTVWKKTVRGKIASELQLHEVREATARTKLAAQPIRPQLKTSSRLTAPKQALSGVQKVIGVSDYKAHAGCCTWLNGVYWIRLLDRRPNGELLIENLHDVGKFKIKQLQAVIEPDLVYPLLRGRDVQRWQADPSAHIILANRTDKLAGIPEAEMKRRWPKTYRYLRQFEGDLGNPERGTLRGRSGYRKYFKPSDPFYSIYNVGPYTMAPWKIVWREQSSQFQAAFVESGHQRPTLPDHKLMMVPCSSQQEAGFILAALNSSPSRLTVLSYAISTSTSTHVLDAVAVPRFSETDFRHARLADLAYQCHAAKRENKEDEVATLEAEIDQIAAAVWNINDAELNTIQRALAEM